MTIPHLKQQEFIDFLTSNNCKVVCDKNWNEFDRIILESNGITFPLQMAKFYPYYVVNKICEDLGIEAPEDCRKAKEQIRGRNREK